MRSLLLICLFVLFVAGYHEFSRSPPLDGLATAAPLVSMGEVFRGY
ncbi:hypothetical protein [Pseudomonas sp. P1.31]|jgi:hypothetical protein|nr:hypothetical protein [Pseudomonas sp. P1.31]